MPKNTVQIGGKIYDAETGALLRVLKQQADIIPVKKTTTTKTTAPAQSRSQHFLNRAKKSTTLNRAFVKDPSITVKTRPTIITKRAVQSRISPKKQPSLRTSSFKSRQIKHFMSLEEARALNSKTPVVLSETINPPEIISAQANQNFKQIIADARKTDFFTKHRMNQIARDRRNKELQALRQAERAFAGQQTALPIISAEQAQLTNLQTKRRLFTEAIAKANNQAPAYKPKNSFFKRHASLIAATLAIVLLGSYLTYLNMPNISLRIAASQAGIDASYPNYQPQGYSIRKLASFDGDKITMEYSNNDKNIIITQQASSWDSKTTLENIVKKQAGEVYNTDQTKGLTIYTYNNQATWINGGILYNLSFNGDISIDQIHKIATSL